MNSTNITHFLKKSIFIPTRSIFNSNTSLINYAQCSSTSKIKENYVRTLYITWVIELSGCQCYINSNILNAMFLSCARILRILITEMCGVASVSDGALLSPYEITEYHQSLILLLFQRMWVMCLNHVCNHPRDRKWRQRVRAWRPDRKGTSDGMADSGLRRTKTLIFSFIEFPNEGIGIFFYFRRPCLQPRAVARRSLPGAVAASWRLLRSEGDGGGSGGGGGAGSGANTPPPSGEETEKAEAEVEALAPDMTTPPHSGEEEAVAKEEQQYDVNVNIRRLFSLARSRKPQKRGPRTSARRVPAK